MLNGLLIVFFSLSGWSMDLFTWKPHMDRPPIVIGVREGETPRLAAERYLTALKDGPRYTNLGPLFDRNPMPEMPLVNFAPLGHSDFKRRALIAANRPEDLAADDWRVPTFSAPLTEEKMPPYLLAFAADASMSDSESKEFIRLLNLNFPRLVGMGGDDVSGEHFGDGDEGSVNFNADRDAFEIALFTHKYNLIRSSNPGDHRIWGTCRALQLIARVAGQKIYPHIDGHGGIGEGALRFRETQKEPLHDIRVLKTVNSILHGIVGANNFVGNSYHHKYSVEVENGYLQKSAVSPDGIPEAYESVDGRIFLLQFHAELMAVRSRGAVQQMGRQIVKGALRFLLYGPKACEQALTAEAA